MTGGVVCVAVDDDVPGGGVRPRSISAGRDVCVAVVVEVCAEFWGAVAWSGSRFAAALRFLFFAASVPRFGGFFGAGGAVTGAGPASFSAGVNAVLLCLTSFRRPIRLDSVCGGTTSAVRGDPFAGDGAFASTGFGKEAAVLSAAVSTRASVLPPARTPPTTAAERRAC